VVALTGWQVTPSWDSNSVVWPGGSKSAIFDTGRGGAARGITYRAKMSSCLSPVLNLKLALIS
jgi:hypothetical protein